MFIELFLKTFQFKQSFCASLDVIIGMIFVHMFVETSRLWMLLVKICRGSQLKEEQQKCAFNLRTDEASATHYFQV